MEPEIARRCSDCGASVRGNAFFCPQCGKTLKARADTAGSTVEAPEMPARRKTDAGLKAPIINPSTSAPAPASDIVPAQENFARDTGAESIQHAEAVATRASVDDDGGATSKRQRMTAAARDVVEEKLSPRVEKLRQASNVMLEEASYDPSLRFVLVAVAVILLSLLLILLNHLIG